MNLIWLVIFLVAAGAAPPAVHRIADQAASASIEGRVVSTEDDRQPVPRVHITVRSTSLDAPRTVDTDEQGRFSITGLRPGRYTVEAFKQGWVRSFFGAEQPWIPPGEPVTLRDREIRRDLVVPLVPGNVIEGRIGDAAGRPYPDSFYVMALRRERVAGDIRLVSARAGLNLTKVDDRGIYRFYGLEPGEYIVAAGTSVTPRGGLRTMTDDDVRRVIEGATSSREVTFGLTFYPGTSDPGAAAPIDVNHGSEKRGLDFSRSAEPSTNLVGKVMTSDGRTPSGARLLLTSEPSLGVRLSYEDLSVGLLGPAFSSVAVADSQGAFIFQSVPAGSYVIRLAPSGQPDTAKGLWTATPVVVSGAAAQESRVVLNRGVRVSGRMSCGRGQDDSFPTSEAVSLQLVRQSSLGAWERGVTVPVRADGSFVSEEIEPGPYRMQASASGGAPGSPWFASRATIDGKNLLDETVPLGLDGDVEGLVVCFTRTPPRLEGAVIDENGAPVADLSIALFSTNRSYWRDINRTTKIVRPDALGKFAVSPLPEGSYYIVAIARVAAADLRDASFLEEAARVSAVVSLRDGQTFFQTLAVGPRRR